jgi:hypothetical protein
MRRVVVLPAPLGPRNPVIRPGSTTKLRLRTASVPLYALTSRSITMGSTGWPTVQRLAVVRRVEIVGGEIAVIGREGWVEPVRRVGAGGTASSGGCAVAAGEGTDGGEIGAGGGGAASCGGDAAGGATDAEGGATDAPLQDAAHSVFEGSAAVASVRGVAVDPVRGEPVDSGFDGARTVNAETGSRIRGCAGEGGGASGTGEGGGAGEAGCAVGGTV